jgi:N-hydroxyarylamine O-acetyltransferase
MEAYIHAWKPLYRFDLQPQALADYEVTSWYLSNHPRSHFVTGLIAARAAPRRREALRNNEWATHHGGGLSERRVLASPAQLAEVLTDVFATRLPPGVDVEQAFARLMPSSIET